MNEDKKKKKVKEEDEESIEDIAKELTEAEYEMDDYAESALSEIAK